MCEYYIQFRLKFKDGTFSCKNSDYVEAENEREAKQKIQDQNAHECVGKVVIDYAGIA